MASECTQETILNFLKENGGKVRNADLIAHFKAVFPEEPGRKAAMRQTFKNYVDNIAYVKSEVGVKYVCVKKKFLSSEREQRSVTEDEAVMANGMPTHVKFRGTSSPLFSRRCTRHAGCADDAAEDSALHTPGSGYGNDSQIRVPHVFPSETIHPDITADNKCREFVCPGEDSCPGEMGNRGSIKREKSRKEQERNAPHPPEISLIRASPLAAEGPVFILPGPAHTAPLRNTLSLEGLKEQSDDEEDDKGQLDTHSLSGSEGNASPKGSREHFLQVMMSSSPQVRHSIAFRNSVYLSSRNDGDSASLASSGMDDESRTSVSLDPLEHEWMMCSSDGEWGSLYQLLSTEPSLVLKKDFVSGFTCLHWAAKHGKPELIALIINFAKQHHVPISVDVRSNTGYTPLHIAAIHNHMEVVKLLVGAYSADVEIRDYSGKKACQYLTDNVSLDIRDIIGAYEHSESKNAENRDGVRWRFSKVLQSKPLKLLTPNDGDCVDGEAPPRQKVVRSKSSLSRMKPRLQKLRYRASQIVHSTSFHDPEEMGDSVRRSFRSRPKTSFFG
ncbi:LOW QUALITY PROTEIN: ankyrin repeat domain-containing protein SOWAHC-like [Eleginops maclovinus]|uniref:LOW QUALITY PROTEIN: ankyrin repeat domain-containing protein SOWAHC-like n=1 Tax=Eleginops maclovinus TaxID=56733 RepID=UPI00307FD78B